MSGRCGNFSQIFVVGILVLTLSVSVAMANEVEKWLLMPGDVVAPHAEFEAECELCHAPLSDTMQGELCVDCHTSIGTDIQQSSGYHGRLPLTEQMECSNCHTDHEGRDFNIVVLNNETFDHSLTDFILRGAHVDTACDGCHQPDAARSEAPSECIGCHVEEDVHHGDLGDDCSSCHVSSDWEETIFNHAATSFPLDGGHAQVECGSCHLSPVFSDVGQTCESCHQSDDVHEGRNGPECGSCHVTENWAQTDFNHFAVSGFRLTGGHDNLACSSCHRADNHKDLGGSSCQSCHGDDDVHNGRFGTACSACHNTVTWAATDFDHAAETDFALPPGHTNLACAACHTGSLQDPLPRDCGTCHRDNDPHRGQLGTECESCHVATDWTAQLWFDHDITAFPLIGDHADVPCAQCHETAAFRDTDGQCISCHADDDAHEGGLGEQCATCHNPASWQAWLFDHDQTGFELTGAHEIVTCNACHTQGPGEPETLAQDCIGCHRRDDRHGGRFGDRCESCHTTESFRQIRGR